MGGPWQGVYSLSTPSLYSLQQVLPTPPSSICLLWEANPSSTPARSLNVSKNANPSGLASAGARALTSARHASPVIRWEAGMRPKLKPPTWPKLERMSFSSGHKRAHPAAWEPS